MFELIIGLTSFLMGGGIVFLLLTFINSRKESEPEVVVIPKDSVFDTTDHMIIIYDSNYKLVDSNKSAKSYFNITNNAEYYSLNSISSDLFNVVKNNQSYTSEFLQIELPKGNRLNHFLLEEHTFKPVGSTEEYHMVSLTNNSDSMKTLNEIKKLKEAAEDSIDEKSMFLANMSHELRTPLNAIIGMSELMIETTLDDSQADLIGSINQSANILYDIINTILDFSKLEANQMGLEEAPIDVKKIVSEISTIFSHEARVKNIDLITDIDNTIPGVLGDQVRLRQIIVNLVGNAIKFTHLGSVNLSAKSVKTTDNSVSVRFTVRDTGIGFNEETKAKILKPFVQEDESVTRKFGGTGLGLPICKSLIEMYGGILDIESQVGEGSTFSFTINFKLSDKTTTKSEPTDAPASERTGKILVAEDNKTNQKLLKMQLERYKYEVSIVDNGQEVVEEYFENEYDLIIMDCQMPVMDGYCATLIIRQQEELFNKHIPIVALTASALKEDKEKCIQTGMDAFITKPVKIETLHKTIQNWLNTNDEV